MSSHMAELPPRRAAVIAAWAYMAMIVFAFYANFFVLGRLVETGDAAATVSNIQNAEGLFRSGVPAFMAVFFADVVAAWALYLLFRHVDRELSLLAAWFRVVYAAVALAALLNLMVAAQLVGGGTAPGTADAGQPDAQVMLFIDAWGHGWAIGLAVFGAYLLLLGYLVARSDTAPTFIAVLLALAGVGYLVNTLLRMVAPDLEDIGTAFSSVTSVVGEISFVVWLWMRGGKTHGKHDEGDPLLQLRRS